MLVSFVIERALYFALFTGQYLLVRIIFVADGKVHVGTSSGIHGRLLNVESNRVQPHPSLFISSSSYQNPEIDLVICRGR